MKKLLMIDIETLSTRPNGVIWQLALVGAPADDLDERLDPPVHSYLPIDPQLNLLVPNRRADGGTLIYWMKQALTNPQAAEKFEQCDSEDFNDLIALVRHFLRGFDRMTSGGKDDYELVTKGNFDLPMLQSLIEQCGLTIPWDFRKTVDLRTLMTHAGVTKVDVENPTGFVAHDAYWDCEVQIRQYAGCLRRMRARS